MAVLRSVLGLGRINFLGSVILDFLGVDGLLGFILDFLGVGRLLILWAIRGLLGVFLCTFSINASMRAYFYG